MKAGTESRLSLMVRIGDSAERVDAARRLAESFGATSLIIFVRDPQLDMMLPAPGFPQTLKGGPAWRELLEKAAEQGTAAGNVFDTAGAGVTACAHAIDDASVLVLLGGDVAGDDTAELRILMPLLARALAGEQRELLAQTEVTLAREAAAQMRTMAMALEEVRSRLQTALRDAELARHKAEDANRGKAMFLAAVSHDLRTPLNAISGYSELIEMGVHGPVTEAQLVALSRIRHSQRHLLGLIDAILQFAKIESGEITYDIGEVPVGGVLSDLVAMVEPQVDAKQLAFGFGSIPDNVIARADREKFEQVLVNILSNAVKFTPAGGRISVTAVRTNGEVHVCVEDTGPGIPHDKLDGIFEPFVQGNSLQKREGVGLGLAISRHLTRAMGGDVTVTSKPGAGSTFCVTLPAAG